ncbi:MAG: DUF3604 domain-containing protein [bacterium]
MTSVAVAAEDYLSESLRKQVENLKAQVAITPTNAGNAAQRTQVMWAWVNAYARNGGYVPVNLTTILRPASPEALPPRMAATFDEYVFEMSLFDEQPDAIGALETTLGPFEARSWATLQQTYTVGTKPIVRGGGIAVPRHFMANYGLFQTSDPAGDNYVSVSSGKPGVEFAVDTYPINGMHGGFRGAQPVLFFRLTRGELISGDTLTVTYGGRAQGGRGLLMPTFSSDRMPFPLYLLFDPDESLVSLPIAPVQVVGSKIAGVHAFAPSVVRPGEKFDLSVRAEDQFYNRAQGPIPGFKVFANDQLLAQLPPAEQAITVISDVSFAKAGVQRITVVSDDGSIQGVANPILVSSDAPKIRWGDTHGHSGFAEGIGTPDRFMQWAKEDARLDFVTHSEHDIWMDDYEWQVLQDNVRKYTEPGRFVAYLGYEWTTRNIFGGHHNVLFRTPDNRERVPTQFYPTLSDLYAGLRAKHDPRDVVVIPHAHQAGNYRLGDPRLQPLVEIMSQHGNFEWFGRMYLSHGQQVGFTAASDNHLSQPGYTSVKDSSLSQRGGLGAVMAEEVSVDAIFDGMKNLSAYATTGDRIILQTQVNGVPMGQRMDFARERNISGRVVGTAPISTITVFKNDEVLWEQDYLTVQEGRLADEETFFLSFMSDSVPKHRGDNPRGWRPWRGTLEVVGADLVSATSSDIINSTQRNLYVDAEHPNTVHFVAASRGAATSMKLVLRDPSRNTRFKLAISEGREFGSGPPIFRRPALVPAAEVELSLRQLDNGEATRTLPFDGYMDTIRLRRVITQGAQDVSFALQDTGDIQGDYYFVRVVQADDAIAWSSPVWVGGYPNR